MSRNYSQTFPVFISGPGSVGKTTLIKELEKYLLMETSSEVARSIIEQKNWKLDDYDPKKNLNNFEILNFEIMRQSAKRVKNFENENVIFDRGVDYLAYLRYYNGEDKYKEAKESIESRYIAERCQQGLVFVVYPHPKCNKSDNVRLEPKLAEQCEFVELMINILDECHADYIPILHLDLVTRVKIVVKEIAKSCPDLLTDLGKKLINDER